MKKAKYRVSFLSILLYIIAILSLLFAYWHFKTNYDYVKTLMDAGQLIFEGSEYEIVTYIFSIGGGLNGAAGLYLLFSVVIAALGVLAQKIKNVAVPILKKLEGDEAKAEEQYLVPMMDNAESFISEQAAEAEEAEDFDTGIEVGTETEEYSIETESSEDEQ